MSVIRKGVNEFVLCNGRTCACPEVTIKDQEVSILDDYGDTIKMTLDQFRVIGEVLETLDKEAK